MKLSIAAKGLILVAVPLIFELAFVGSLYFSLKQAEHEIDSELRRQATFEQLTILYRHMLTESFVCGFHMLASESNLPDSQTSRKNIIDTLNEVDRLVGNEPSQKFCCMRLKDAIDSYLKVLKNISETDPSTMMANINSGQGSVFSEMENGMKSFDRGIIVLKGSMSQNGEERDKSSDSELQRLLLTAVFFDISITVLLALSFARNISTRLNKLAENTRRVSRNLPPMPLLGGTDELSGLDLVIHKMSDELKAAEAQRKQLTSMVRGKLQAPLSEARSIMLSLQESNSTDLPAPAIEWMRKSAANLDRLLHLLEDLTQLQQLDEGKIELKKTELKSTDLVKNAIESVQSLAGKKQVQITSDCKDLSFYGDRERITQVLINFLSNAIKFSPKKASIFVTVKDLIDEVEFRVRDQGPGVPKEVQGKIFERYEQSNRDDATSRGGAGLGLNICSIIADSHGGDLGVDSEVGFGSEFWLRLPKAAQNNPSRALPEKETRSRKASEPRSSKAKYPSLRIWQKGLVVVAVPLILQMIFLFFLSNMLMKAQNEIDEEMHTMKINSSANDVFRESLSLCTHSAGIRLRPDPSIDILLYGYSVKGLLKELINLFELTNTNFDLSQQACAISKSTEEVLINTGKVTLYEHSEGDMASFLLLKKRLLVVQRNLDELATKVETFLSQLQQVKERSPLIRAQTRQNIAILILSALALSIFLSVALGLYFSKSISKRVTHLIENTLRFTANKELLAPLEGQDELAEFDKDFRSMVERIEQNQEFKRHILAVVSHELRTPLTSIYGSLTLMLSGALGPISQQSLVKASTATNNISQVIQLVNDLLDIERLEAGKFPVEIKTCSMNEILDQSLRKANEILQRDKALSVRNLENLLVKVDPEISVKAFSKLIVFCAEEQNSSDQTPIEILITKEQNFACVKVSDMGFGARTGASVLVFEKFQQDSGDNSGNKGAALTLSLCQTIFTRMDGEISLVKSNDAHRGYFKILLPLALEK